MTLDRVKMGLGSFCIAAAVLTMGLGGLAACERQGPAERAGERIDEAIEETGEAIRDAGRGDY